MTEARETSTLVLGLGNLLCGDDGLGVVAVERLRERYDVPLNVALVDGGTLGLALLPTIEDADEIWILDAVEADAAPGTLVALEGRDVEPALRERLSCHQIGVADLLDALHWRDTMPDRLRVLGLVPEQIELGLGLSAPVAANLDALVEAAAWELIDAGHALGLRARSAISDDSQPLGPHVDRIPRALGL